MTKQQAPLRREEILAAAVEQLSARGVNSTRATDVAAALGISSGLIFYHFESKDQLIAEAFTFVVDQGLSELRGIVAADAPVVERMTNALSLYGPDREASGWRIWLDGWSASLRNEPLRQTVMRLDEAWEDAFHDLVHEGITSGVFAVADASAASMGIMSILDGTAVQSVVRGDTDRSRARRAAAAAGVISILRPSEADAAAMLAGMSQAH